MNAAQKQALRDRALRALQDLYHNATPDYPRDLLGRSEEEAQDWFQSTAEFEIEYIASGGAYGTNYRATLAAPCNAGRYKSERARAYYVRKGLRARDEERAKYARWERIGEFGKLYQWGRGGRTLAPDGLIRQRGGSTFSIRTDYAEGMPIADVVDLIQVLESFNAHVAAWCASVPEQWREHCEEDDRETRAQRKREREYDRLAKLRADEARCFL